MLASRLFDLAGGPELAELALHIVTHSTPLTAGERAAGAEILGAHALRWDEVRVAQGGLLNLIFRRNGGRAFAAWHTICLPGTGLRVRENLGLIVHELVHVYQYELLGAAYMIEALLAQRSVEGYNYGAARDLRQGHAEGKPTAATTANSKPRSPKTTTCSATRPPSTSPSNSKSPNPAPATSRISENYVPVRSNGQTIQSTHHRCRSEVVRPRVMSDENERDFYNAPSGRVAVTVCTRNVPDEL